MKQFTATGKLRHWDEKEGRLISLEAGDTVQLRDELVKFFCNHGWGAAPGIETKPAVPGVVELKAR
jgi:hypothetical protein